MAWWKASPSPLLLLSLLLLTVSILNTHSHAFRPNSFHIVSHMREYAVYANEHGVPELERGDSPAKDPEIIQDEPIPTVKPTLIPPSPSPSLSPSPIQSHPDASATKPSPSSPFSEPASAVSVSDPEPASSSSAHDAPPTVSDSLSASSSTQPSASASPSALPPLPSPTPHDPSLGGNSASSDTDNHQNEEHQFADDMAISATADDILEQPQPELEEAADVVESQGPDPQTNDAASQSLSSGQLAPVSEQSAPPENEFKPASIASSGGQAPTVEPTKPLAQPPTPTEHPAVHPDSATDQSAVSHEQDEGEEIDEEEPLVSPLVDEQQIPTPAPVKTAAPPSVGTKNGNDKPPKVFNSKAPVQLHVEEDHPVPQPEPSQSFSPLPSPGQLVSEEIMETSMLEKDDISIDSSFEEEVMTQEIEAVPVVLESEEDDKSVSIASPSPVSTAIAPSSSIVSPAPPTTIGDDAPSSADAETSKETQGADVGGDVEIDESFTCTYFGKGSIPKFDKPDESSFTGDVSTFAVGASDFPDLDPQYLSHVYGASWGYTFSVDDSSMYDVVLGFAEVFAVACEAGQDSGYRVFDALVGKQTTRIDVMGIVGCGKPLQKVYPDVIPSENTITMKFEQVSQQAMLSTMCYRKTGALNSNSPAIEPTPSPPEQSSVAVTAIPPGGEALTSNESSDSSPTEEPSSSGSQKESLYKCVNFGPEAINGYDLFKSKAITGETEVYAGSSKYNNALPEPYWSYVHGQKWSYSLEVSTSAPQNINLGYAETSPEACETGKSFSVSVNGGIPKANVSENVGCGVIYQLELESVTPIDGVIEISFTAESGDAVVSVLCYADASETETEGTSIVGTEPTSETSDSESTQGTSETPETDGVEEALTSSENTSIDPTSVAALNDSSTTKNGGSCFSFGENTVPGFLHAVPLPSDVSYYSDAKAVVSGIQDGSVFSSHIYGEHFSLSITTNDQSLKSVFIGFAEIYKPACVTNQRQFTVTVGSLTKTVDIFEEVGCSTALILRIDDVTPNSDNNIEIGFSAVKDNAMVSTVCVIESVGNSLGKPSSSLVSELPPTSMLDNSAVLNIGTGNSQNNKPLETPVPSPTFVTVIVPIDETQSDAIVNSGENADSNPANSPFPEFNGLIDATITVSPSPDESNDAGSTPHSGSDEIVENDETIPDMVTSGSEDDETQIVDLLLPTNFSQTTFGESPSTTSSSSPMEFPSNDIVPIVLMHPTGSDSSGFPQSAAVEDIGSMQTEEMDSNESSEVIVVLDESLGPSPSPSARAVRDVDTLAENESDAENDQTVSPSSPPSPIPKSGVILTIDGEGENPTEQAAMTSETPSPSAAPDSGVIISVVGGEEQAQQSLPAVSESFTPSPIPTSDVTLFIDEGESSQASQAPTAAPSPSDSTVILVGDEGDSAILMTTSEESTVVVTESDLEDEPMPSATPVEGDQESLATAIPPGSISTNTGNGNNDGSSNDLDEAVVVAVGSDSAVLAVDSQSNLSPSPSPVSVAISPDASADGTDSGENDQVQVLVPEAEGTPIATSASSDIDGVVIPVDATDISSFQPSPSAVAVAIPPSAIVTDNQIEIVISDGPTVTPTPGTTLPSAGEDVDVVILDDDPSDASVEAPNGVSLEDLSPDGTAAMGGVASSSPSPSPTLIVSVTGSDTVIIGSTSGTTGAEVSPIPAPSAVPVAAPEAVTEVPDRDENVIQVSDSENGEVVDSSALTGDENVPSIIEGDYKELIGTVPAGNGFSIGMGVLGALLVLLLLILLFFAIRSDGAAYSYSSQYSSRKPSDYGGGDTSQGGYTEGLNQGGYTEGLNQGSYAEGMNQGSYAEGISQGGGGIQNDSYTGGDGGGYRQGQPSMESQPNDGAESFGYEKPEDGLGGVSGSYGNVGPDTYAAYSSLNLQDGPTTMDVETNMYSQSEALTMDGQDAFHYSSGTRNTTFSGAGLRESAQPTEYGESTTQYYAETATLGEAETSMIDETVAGASEFEKRISMFGGRESSNRASSGQEADEDHSFHENHSVARPNSKSASSGNQGREYGMDLGGTGYETVSKEEREQYNALLVGERNSAYISEKRIQSGREASERMLSMSPTPTAVPSPYETDMQGQIDDSDSGNAYQRSPMLAPSDSISVSSADIGQTGQRRMTNGDISHDEVLDDYHHNECNLRGSARQGNGTLELHSDLSNDGPWPWWWSDQKDKKGVLDHSSSPLGLEPEQMDKENASLPSNQSPVEQSSSGLSTEDAKAAVIVEDAVILKPSDIAKLGHLPAPGSKWGRQYSSTSDGTSRERSENNPYFDELRKRREPYVKVVANRLSTGVKSISPESGESLLEQARKEFEEQHSQQPSLGFSANDPSSWVTQGVEV
eukprot:gb/GEZJ01002141.1/.p1 GENE.gb/GEZJ01002141.1/~~gb/GEZJ01002141.1/.p1  ORF type:complete len:2365 (-),score=350.48 gb/GEZJ01002141.1/:1392-8486(-)